MAVNALMKQESSCLAPAGAMQSQGSVAVMRPENETLAHLVRGHQLHAVSVCCGHYIRECNRRGMLLSCFGQGNQTRCLGSRKAALPVCPPHSTSGTHCVGSSLLRFADSLGVTETQLYVQQPLGKPCRALRGSVMGDSGLGAWAHVSLSLE